MVDPNSTETRLTKEFYLGYLAGIMDLAASIEDRPDIMEEVDSLIRRAIDDLVLDVIKETEKARKDRIGVPLAT